MYQRLTSLVISWRSILTDISFFLDIKKQIEKIAHWCYTYLSKNSLTEVNNFCLTGDYTQPIV